MKKVIVIGAGVAGISAAIEICQSGHEVLLLEQKAQIGGRIYSIEDNVSGDLIDNGQHLLTGAYHRFLEILKILGTDGQIKKQKSLAIDFYSKNGLTRLDSSKLPGSLGMLFGLLALKNIKITSKLAAISLAIKLKIGMEGNTDEDCHTFLRRHNQGDDLITLFWEPLILATINADMRTAPAKLLVNVLKKAFFADRQSAVLMFPTADLNQLLEPLAGFLANNNSKIKLSAKVAKLNISENVCKGVTLSNGEIIEADAVIIAVPPYSLQKMLPNDSVLAEFATKLTYSPIISVYFWFEHDLFDFDFAGIIGYNSQWIFNRRRLIDVESPKYGGHITVTVSAAESLMKMSLDEIAELVFEEIREIFKLDKEIRYMRHKVIIEKFATPLFTCENEKQRPHESTALEGLFVSGDWCDTGLPATIEGAAISGLNAAKLAKKFLV
jgi:squalene-associated FAD-dependent desaturase